MIKGATGRTFGLPLFRVFFARSCDGPGSPARAEGYFGADFVAEEGEQMDPETLHVAGVTLALGQSFVFGEKLCGGGTEELAASTRRHGS